MSITEDQLEQLCLDWFREGGYDYAYGPDIAHDGKAPEREDYKQILLARRLLDALQRINPHPVETLEEQVLDVLNKPESPVLIRNNYIFQKYLLEGVPVQYTDKAGDKQSDHVQLVGFKYGDRLLETLRKYRNRAIETAQVIEELIQMAKDFQEAMKRHEDLGLNEDELAFYDALANNESAVRELGDDTLKKIAHELVEQPQL